MPQENNLIIAQLTEQVNYYESSLPLPEQDDRILQETKAELEEKTIDRIKGVMFRSKAKWLEEGEKNTKYFYSLEKARYNAKTCYKMINDKDQEIDTAEEILQEQKEFYTKLYDVDLDIKFSMENQSGLKVPEEIKEIQQQQLTCRDLEGAIKTMNRNKTPGEDGIPADFYKVFWNKLKKAFHAMVLQCYQEEELHSTARKGILNLIPKPNKDPRYIKNLRPITLLNTDYKIIEKAIANKMIPALPHYKYTKTKEDL